METYDRIGTGYASARRADHRIAAAIGRALGSAATVLNVGAGAGSYEPGDRAVTAVEPSQVMIDQRPPGAARTIRAAAEALPFPDRRFDAAMAILTLHHWAVVPAGLAELRRVARDRVVILTRDPAHVGFWMTSDYLPQALELDRGRFPTLVELARGLGRAEVRRVPIPADCTDGFFGAFWRRPEAYLDPAVRAGISTFSQLDPAAVDRGLRRLHDDLARRRWHDRHGRLLDLPELDVGYRLVIAGRGDGAGP